MTYKTLLIEDDRDIREVFEKLLKSFDCDVTTVEDGAEGKKMLERGKYDLIITDWNMPHLTGIELVRWLRTDQKVRTPVLMATVRNTKKDVIEGLEAGADDFVTKPVDLDILESRIHALMRRADILKEIEPIEYKFQDLVVNTQTRETFICGEKVNLTKYEFNLLKILIENRGRVLSRVQIMSGVQGDNVVVTSRAVDTLVFMLRDKLGKKRDFIQAVRGVGYRIDPSFCGDDSTPDLKEVSNS